MTSTQDEREALRRLQRFAQGEVLGKVYDAFWREDTDQKLRADLALTLASLPAPDTAVKGCGYGTCNRCYRDTCRHFPQAPEAPSERTEIAAWLREQAEVHAVGGILFTAKHNMADAIERGDYRARKIGGAS